MDQPRRRNRKRVWLALGVISLATLSLGSFGVSLALFTDQQTVDNTFTTGSVLLDGPAIDQLVFAPGAMVPGDQRTDDVLVHNIGTVQLRYAVSQTSADDSSPNGGPLYGALDLTVRTIDATTPGVPCDDFDGTLLSGPAVMGAAGNLVGNPNPGPQGGERTLNAGASETLCFRVSLPGGTGNAYQGAQDTTTFIFDAEQTANNP